MSTEVNHAREQAIAKVESIKAMMDRLEHADECNDYQDCPLADDVLMLACGATDCQDSFEYHDVDKAKEAIDESPLSVEVRSGWHTPNSDGVNLIEPVEYCLLLCTGGSAVRIIGTLGFYSEPDTARIEYQDWGTPWTELGQDWAWKMPYSEQTELLLSYARQFWYGE